MKPRVFKTNELGSVELNKKPREFWIELETVSPTASSGYAYNYGAVSRGDAIHVIEKSAYDNAVTKGYTLVKITEAERDKWKEQAEKLAAALKHMHYHVTPIQRLHIETALADFEKLKKEMG